MASILSWKLARHFHTHAVGGGEGVAQPLFPSSATASFPHWREEEDDGVRDGFASDLVFPSRWALLLFGNSAEQGPFSPQLKQLLRFKYRSLGFSLESLVDIPSRGRRSDLSLSLRCNSLRFSSASREREENRDDAEELLRS